MLGQVMKQLGPHIDTSEGRRVLQYLQGHDNDNAYVVNIDRKWRKFFSYNVDDGVRWVAAAERLTEAGCGGTIGTGQDSQAFQIHATGYQLNHHAIIGKGRAWTFDGTGFRLIQVDGIVYLPMDNCAIVQNKPREHATFTCYNGSDTCKIFPATPCVTIPGGGYWGLLASGECEIKVDADDLPESVITRNLVYTFDRDGFHMAELQPLTV
jgi:hypothetical protein